ncbi:16S rRNA (uracil(1498)-N(3))-methyltransferase [Arcobacter porcinus]|uniref:Ribosomal RNA small subunit methyltransferase E n=1 Tax=Arcobacter porcinus TaxID=1935204 RepID=A0ABX2YEU1_9BACT|nr:16S rRNA (uracil(1498)-N(3))-methyltransferase [Arcobacter porcinus]OCL81711.1 Ribosomal RNA small subunit methyltransferase E [Arcobacter porcinus]OCL84497.1 Ribosomal RNA small subunit methyltransferase E [Arcobacter porcinus]OCL89038.1 Ribosomal RNA small subunit methyltransferase E [Arcobacter porcinus]OCL93520.1 Ribosomal RNA small subunit methyltransferase E [Arcobacter porcinus]
MQYVFDKNAKDNTLFIKDENYNYLIKARRHKIGDKITFRNLEDNFIYIYNISSIDKKSAILTLETEEEKILENDRKLHLAWCIVDPKTIYENITSLNELGVSKISFIYSDFSQKNFKINFEKLEKVLINSSSQCGRSSIFKIDTYKSIDEFIKEYPKSYILDFSNQLIEDKKDLIDVLIVGPEGGFSKRERELFKKEFVIGFKSNLILRSETAIISASSKIII